MDTQLSDDRGTSEQSAIGAGFEESFDEAAGVVVSPGAGSIPVSDTPQQPTSNAPDNTPVPDDRQAALDAAQNDNTKQESTQDPLSAPTTPQPSASEPPPSPAPDDPQKTEQKYRTLQGIHRKDKETWEERERRYQQEIEDLKAGRMAAPSTPTLQPSTPSPAPSAPPAPSPAKDYRSELPESDREDLAQYEDEFDVVTKFEGIKRDLAIKEMEDRLTNSIRTELSTVLTQLSPFISQSSTAAQETHFRSIREAHPDFESFRDDGSIGDWVASKPAYLQDTLNSVLSKGSSDQVVDLITMFKEETGIVADLGNTSIAPSNPNTPLPPSQADNKRAALRAVPGRNAAVNTQPQMAGDFEGAFDEAVRRMAT